MNPKSMREQAQTKMLFDLTDEVFQEMKTYKLRKKKKTLKRQDFQFLSAESLSFLTTAVNFIK